MKAIVPRTCRIAPRRRVRPTHREAVPILVRSSEPSVVFTSLVHASTPLLSDWCSVDVTEHPDTRYAIEPFAIDATSSPGNLWAHSIRTQVHGPAAGGLPGYAVWITNAWRSAVPTPRDIRRTASLADKAVHIVDQERLRRQQV